MLKGRPVLTTSPTHPPRRRGAPRRRIGRAAAVALCSVVPLTLVPAPAMAAPQTTHSFNATPQCPASLTDVTMTARSRWVNAPANGYMHLARQRQAVSDDGSIAVTAHKTLQTKDTRFEGSRVQFRWTDFTSTAQAAQWGYWTRSVFVLKWMKDDALRDTVVKKAVYATEWCQQPA